MIGLFINYAADYLLTGFKKINSVWIGYATTASTG